MRRGEIVSEIWRQERAHVETTVACTWFPADMRGPGVLCLFATIRLIEIFSRARHSRAGGRTARPGILSYFVVESFIYGCA